MPIIPIVQRQISIKTTPADSIAPQMMDIRSAGLVGDAIARAGATGVAATDVWQETLARQKAEKDAIDIATSKNIFDRMAMDYRAKTEAEKVGEKAYGTVDQAKIDLDGMVQGHLKSVRPDQVPKLQVLLNSIVQQNLEHFTVYELGQRKVAKDTIEKDTFSTNNQKIATISDSPSSVRETIAEHADLMLTLGVDQNKIDHDSALLSYQAVVTAINNNDLASAKAHYTNYKTLLDAAGLGDDINRKMKGIGILREGTDVGVEIFKADRTGSLEAMTDAVRARKMDVEKEKIAIAQIKELYNERKDDETRVKTDAVEKVNAILAPIALKRKGLNKQSDLTPAQWQDLTDKAPEYAQRLQDSIRKDLDYKIRADKAEARMRQADNESSILTADDFETRDLKSDLVSGNISTTQYTKLLAAQQKLDPIKRDSVRMALNKVTSGSALGKSIEVRGNDEATWKLKYGDLVKAWAYNHADDPDFDNKMTAYVEKHVLSDMVTSWFASDDADRLDKYQMAKKEAGDLPKRTTPKKPPINKEEAIAELKRRGVLK